MNLIPILLAGLFLLIPLVSVISRRKNINLILLAAVVAFVYRLYPNFPSDFSYFEVNSEFVLWIFIYTAFIIIIQNEIKNYLVPVIYGITALLVMVNSIVPYYLLFELLIIVCTVLIIKTSEGRQLPGLYLPVSLSLSVLTGLNLMLFVSTGSSLFAVIFIFLVVIRTGLFPLWIMERKLFAISPFVYSLFLVSRTLAAVLLIIKLNKFVTAGEQQAFVNSAIIYVASLSVLIAGMAVNRTRDALNYFSSLFIVPVSLLYLSICAGLNRPTIFINFATVIAAAVLLPNLYARFLNKLKVDSKLQFLEFVSMKKTNMFYYIAIIALLFLPLPISPLLLVEYELIRSNAMNPVIGAGIILCNVCAVFVIARVTGSRKN
jgi:hypothetical protein